MRMATSFVLEAVGRGRVGTLAFGDSNLIPTPAFLLHTTGGSVPHLTPDVLNRVFPPTSTTTKPLLLVSLDTCFTFAESLAQFGGGIAKFAGLTDYPGVFLSPHNPLPPLRSGYNVGNSVACWTRTGKKGLELGDFIKMIPSFKPTFVQALSDYDVGPETREKRLKKSTTKTLQYLEGLATTKQNNGDLFATVELSWWVVNEEEAKKTVEAMLTDKRHLIHGFIISGAAFTPKLKEEKNDKGKKVTRLVESVDYAMIEKIKACLPPQLPIYIPGPFSPSQIVELALIGGCDLFDSSWVSASADLGLLLNMDQVIKRFPTISIKANEEAILGSKDKNNDGNPSSIISIKDKQYFEDFTPISNACSCYTCRKHTKSYLNHLYATEELLGPVLSMIHNLTALTTLMETLRHLIKAQAQEGVNDGRRNNKDLEILQEILSSS